VRGLVHVLQVTFREASAETYSLYNTNRGKKGKWKKKKKKNIAMQCGSLSYDMWCVIHGKGKITSSIFALLVHLPRIYTYTFADLYPALAKHNRKSSTLFLMLLP